MANIRKTVECYDQSTNLFSYTIVAQIDIDGDRWKKRSPLIQRLSACCCDFGIWCFPCGGSRGNLHSLTLASVVIDNCANTSLCTHSFLCVRYYVYVHISIYVYIDMLYIPHQFSQPSDVVDFIISITQLVNLAVC